MKCSKCGHRSNTIAAMARHYRKKHPGTMKHRSHAAHGENSPQRSRRRSTAAGAQSLSQLTVCPRCGLMFVPS